MKLNRKYFLAVVTGLTCSIGFSSIAKASIVYDIRVSSVSGGGVNSGNAHSVTVTATGGTINFDVFAVVNSPTLTTGTDDGFSTTRGYIAPAGSGPKGNLSGGLLASPFNDSAAVVGQNIDINGDTFFDYGNLASSSTLSIIPHAPSPGASGGAPAPAEFKIYSFSMLVTSLGAGNTTIGWTNVATGTQAQWKEDAVTKFASTGVLGTPLTVTVSSPAVEVPEPASLGVLALGAIGLLVRRRK